MDKTNAIRQLDRIKAAYKIHTYNGGALSGVDVAAVLCQNPDCVFKTLVTEGKSGANYVFMIPVAAELDLKKAAKAAGEKAISMLPQKNLLPLTGYIHGGCSPIGMKKLFPTFIHSSAKLYDTIFFSAGRVGMQIETAFDQLERLIPLFCCDLICE